MKRPAFILLCISFLISCGSKKVTPEIFLIPTDYRGEIKIIYDQPCGQKEEFDGKKRVYRIPENGVLITQFKQELGIINQEYYFVDAKGSRTPIEQMDMASFNQDDSTKKFNNEPPRDKVGMFFGFTGDKSWDSGNEKIFFYGCYIGSFTQVRYSWMDNSAYSTERDSVERKALNNCRDK